jgi:hypothetical protein
MLPEDMITDSPDARLAYEQAIAKINDLPIPTVLPEKRSYTPGLDRVLFHEMLHFWQQAAATFMIRLAEENWMRMRAFERTGAIEPPGSYGTEYTYIYPEAGYSARDLQECLARFWEIIVFNPSKLIQLELENPQRAFHDSLQTKFKSLVEHRPQSLLERGSQNAMFLLAMEFAAGRYGKPFLDLAAQTPPYVAAGLFPVAGYFALQTERPVRFFKELMARALSIFGKGIPDQDLTHISYTGLHLLANELNQETVGRPLVLGVNTLRDSLLVENPAYSYLLAKIDAFIAWHISTIRSFHQVAPQLLNLSKQLPGVQQAADIARGVISAIGKMRAEQFPQQFNDFAQAEHPVLPPESPEASDFFRGWQDSRDKFLLSPNRASDYLVDSLIACPGDERVYQLLREHLTPPCIQLPDGQLLSGHFVEPGPIYRSGYFIPGRYGNSNERGKLLQSRAHLMEVAESCLDVDRRWRRFREASRGF